MSATKKRRNQGSGKNRTAASVRYREDHLQAIRSLLAKDRDVREGRMFGSPALFVAPSHVRLCVYNDGIELPPNIMTRLNERGDAIAFRHHGKPKMRGWVQINRSCSEDYVAAPAVFLASKRFSSANGDKGAHP